MPEELPQILESGGTEGGTVVGGARRYRKPLKCLNNAVGTGPPSRCRRQFQNLDPTGSPAATPLEGVFLTSNIKEQRPEVDTGGREAPGAASWTIPVACRSISKQRPGS